MGKLKFNEEQINIIKEDYINNFKSVLEISKDFKCDGSVITRILKENGIEKINGSAFSVNYWIKRGMGYDDALYKVKTMKPCLVEYWQHRGFNLDESKLKVELHLMNTERAFIIKYGEIEGSKMYNEKKSLHGKIHSPRSIGYWLNKGFNEEESKEKIKDVQKTFTLEKCIKKFGIIDGEKIYNERQINWVNKIKNKPNINEINIKKNSKSLDAIIKRNSNNYVEEFYKVNINNGEFDFLINTIKECDYVNFLKLISEKYKYSNKILSRISKIKLFQYVFKKNKDELKTDLMKLYDVRTKQSYGTTFIVNGVIVRSLGEKKIFELLNELGIKFMYDKLYTQHEKLKYDFYLNDYQIYIEYFGMLNVNETVKNKDIIKSYKLKCQLKKDICKKYNYKHFFSSKIENILEFIKNIKNNEKKNNTK